MTLTYLNSFDELSEVYDEIDAQFSGISFAELMENEVENLMDEHQSYFDQEESPAGVPWEDLKPATVNRKGHSMILFETGKLEDSLTSRTSDTVVDFIDASVQTLIFGTSVEYAHFHMEKSQYRPARPMVGINESYVEALIERIADTTIAKMKSEKQHTRSSDVRTQPLDPR